MKYSSLRTAPAWIFSTEHGELYLFYAGTDCSSLSLPRATDPFRKPAPVCILCVLLLCCGTSICCIVESSVNCRWISSPMWYSMDCMGACFSKLLSRYCRLISAPAPGALPHLPSSLTLVSAELILSRLSHSSLTGLVFQARSDVEVLSIHQKLPRLSEGPFIPF